MEIQTTRFGLLSIEDERVMTFTRGLLGFPDHSRFALIQTGDDNYFFWLQSVDDPNLAFVVTDPTIFFKDYEVPIREETSAEIAIEYGMSPSSIVDETLLVAVSITCTFEPAVT